MLKKSLKRVFTIGLCVVTCTAFFLGCSTTKTASKNHKKEITLCESWNFNSGFFTVLSPYNMRIKLFY